MEEERSARLFTAALVFTFLMKVMLALAVPITSDEAYFTVWAMFPDLGYYDHPPMIGWLLYLLSFAGHSVLLLRLPAVLATVMIGAGIYLLLKDYDRTKASLAAAFFLVSPLNVLNVLITNDTPLLFFSFLSAAFLFAALKKDSFAYYALSGLSLGCAFLSKYFAVLLGFSYAVYFVFSKKTARKTAGFALLFALVVPFVLLNLYWNYTHCWVNILFNLFNRNKKEAFSLGKVLVFVVTQLYLITPPAVYYLLRSRRDLAARFAGWRQKVRVSPFAVFAFACAVPLSVFGLLSFKKVIGLHWVLAFYPFLFILFFFLLSREQLRKSIAFMVYFTGAHLLLIAVALSLPLDLFRHNKNYGIIVMGMHPGEIVRQVRKYEGDYYLATPSYAESAVMTCHSGRYFSVFGGGSHHGRQDDIITDYAKLSGRNILVLTTSRPDETRYGRFFDSVRVSSFTARGAAYYLVLGSGFRYPVYREEILAPVRDNYYTIPPYLPVSRSSCYFYDKYFPELAR